MKKMLLVACSLLPVACSFAQTINQRLNEAYRRFEADSQLRHAISSLYIINAKTGEVIFDKNSQVGLAGASTQKIVTAATAFELLGKGYRYKTLFATGVGPENETAILIKSSGDPTFGSWRWENTSESAIIKSVVTATGKISGLKEYKSIILVASGWNSEIIPDGWIWQDIGNYYGAGASVLNWRENQFDLFLRSGSSVGDTVALAGTEPALNSYIINSAATSAAKGTGDNAYIYLPAGSKEAIVRGTIPVNEERFKISGSIQNPFGVFISTFTNAVKDVYKWTPASTFYTFEKPWRSPSVYYTHYSPPLDSIVYWFLKKSINLYGEALVKTFAYEKQGFGSTDSGVNIVKKFWKEKGLDDEELNVYDGSGLSPLNRLTTHAQVEILKYAKTRDWFPAFYDALPEYNGMKLKSGTISDVKGFCGYHKAKDGTEYIVSFLVNNYNGKSSSLVGKMYKVLDELK